MLEYAIISAAQKSEAEGLLIHAYLGQFNKTLFQNSKGLGWWGFSPQYKERKGERGGLQSMKGIYCLTL